MTCFTDYVKMSTKLTPDFALCTLYSYTPPEWAKTLQYCPHHRIKIAQIPTPIHKWDLPHVKEGYSISVKRDDLTGAALSGNKIRKLEFLMAAALTDKCDSVITIGDIQSNHCRATAIISRQLGLQPHLLLRSKDMDVSIGCRGNLLLDCLMGSQIVLCPYRSSANTVLSDGTTVTGLDALSKQYAQTLRSKGNKPYVIPVGGSNKLGIWSYLEAYREMIDQGVLEQFDDVVMAAGCTAAGVAIANYLTGCKLKVHGVCVCDNVNTDYFYSKLDGYLKEFGMTKTADGSADIQSRDILDIIDGFEGDGYALSTDEELKLLIEVSNKTGILLDCVYTLKAVRGMLTTLTNDPGRFKGKRILFLHTGGIHSLFDGRLDSMVLNCKETSRISKLDDFVKFD